MNSPVVGAPPKVAGTIKRINDPHPFMAESMTVIMALFAQHAVVWPAGCQRRHQQVVCLGVALLFGPPSAPLAISHEPIA